jgi:hypothetical protein
MKGIFYHPGKTFVPMPASKYLRDFLDDVSQLVALDGVAVEEALKKSGGLFSFLEEVDLHVDRTQSA